MQSTFFGSGGSVSHSLTCRLHATSPTGTFKRCRWRISGTYRTYGTHRTKADRMASSFSKCLLWCGSRPPVQQMKKSFRLRLIRVPQVPDVPNVPSVLQKIKSPRAPLIPARKYCGCSSDFCAERFEGADLTVRDRKDPQAKVRNIPQDNAPLNLQKPRTQASYASRRVWRVSFRY